MGRTQPDGSRVEGDLEKFVSREQWQHIVELAANDSENNGKYEEAIKLYDLSQVSQGFISFLGNIFCFDLLCLSATINYIISQS